MTIIDSSRQSGLGGVPASLLHLREEVGLSGNAWESLGADWQALGALWLRAETAIATSGRRDLSFTQIRKSTLPDSWKEWMNAKLMKTATQRPPKSFGKVLTDYLKSLPSTKSEGRDTIMTEVWCRPGETGIIGLLLCLYWQSGYPGAGNDWKANVKRVEHIYNAILVQTDL